MLLFCVLVPLTQIENAFKYESMIQIQNNKICHYINAQAVLSNTEG